MRDEQLRRMAPVGGASARRHSPTAPPIRSRSPSPWEWERPGTPNYRMGNRSASPNEMYKLYQTRDCLGNILYEFGPSDGKGGTRDPPPPYPQRPTAPARATRVYARDSRASRSVEEEGVSFDDLNNVRLVADGSKLRIVQEGKSRRKRSVCELKETFAGGWPSFCTAAEWAHFKATPTLFVCVEMPFEVRQLGSALLTASTHRWTIPSLQKCLNATKFGAKRKSEKFRADGLDGAEFFLEWFPKHHAEECKGNSALYLFASDLGGRSALPVQCELWFENEQGRRLRKLVFNFTLHADEDRELEDRRDNWGRNELSGTAVLRAFTKNLTVDNVMPLLVWTFEHAHEQAAAEFKPAVLQFAVENRKRFVRRPEWNDFKQRHADIVIAIFES
ncbi:hypothetical protein M3Y99_01348000 [Aphelenchoides fujianensis]|nr:hypothetical protein M3Y99_01348000 [Aphelenchoides fujianensis]